MGSRGAFLPQGGFSEPLKYQEIGQIEDVKVLRDTTAQKQSLPQHANMSSAYVDVDSRGNVKQLRVFEKRLPAIDIDLDILIATVCRRTISTFTNTLTAAKRRFAGACVGGMEPLAFACRRNFDEAKMSKNALEFILAEYEKRGGLLD